MPQLGKLTYEKFATFVASGLSLAESYRRTTGRTKNADVKGSQWQGYTGIKERIEELRQENDKRARLSRDEALRFLSDAIRTPADVVPERSWVIQSIKRSDDGTTVEIKLPDKVQCVAQMARMCNWNASERITLEAGDSLTRYLAELRSKPIPIGHAVDVAPTVKQLPEQSEQPSSAERDHEQ
jgi:hypothetical protein